MKKLFGICVLAFIFGGSLISVKNCHANDEQGKINAVIEVSDSTETKADSVSATVPADSVASAAVVKDSTSAADSSAASTASAAIVAASDSTSPIAADSAAAAPEATVSTDSSKAVALSDSAAAVVATSDSAAVTAVAGDSAAVADSTETPKAMRRKGPTPWRIIVSITDQHVYIYKNKKLVKNFICSTGTISHPTPTGRFILNASGGARGQKFTSKKYGGWSWWYTGFIGGTYLFHAVPGSKSGQMGANGVKRLGTRASHGCIRLLTEEAKFIHDTVPDGTIVEIKDKTHLVKGNPPQKIKY